VGIGGTSGMDTDDSEIFRLDNLEFEVAGGACGSFILLAWVAVSPRGQLSLVHTAF